MTSENDRKPSQAKLQSPAPKKRFRIEKLEERIAPKKKGDGGGGGGQTSSGLSWGSPSIY